MIPCFCCGAELYCGCDSCRGCHAGEDLFIPSGDFERCSVCGFTALHDVWLDLEYEYYIDVIRVKYEENEWKI